MSVLECCTLVDVEKLISKFVTELSTELVSMKSATQDRTVERVRELIQKRYTDKGLSLELIADEMHLSPDYLRRIFKQSTGQSIARALTEARITQTKNLLSSTHLTVNGVAHLSGFPSIKYFFTIFRSETGLTPTEFRLLNREESRESN